MLSSPASPIHFLVLHETGASKRSQCSRCLLLALHDRVCTRFFRQPFSRQDVDGGAPLFINECGGYWALPPLSLGLLAAHLFGCQATPSMPNFVVTLVHFLCGLRWELPSVLDTAQSRGSPNRSWCQRHCTLALLLVNGSVLLHLAHLQCHNLVRHALKRAPNPNTPLGNLAAYCSLCMAECTCVSSGNVSRSRMQREVPSFRSSYWALPLLSLGLLAARLLVTRRHLS